LRMYDIIYKKRFGGNLSQEEIEHFVSGYVSGDIADYQASALLMAICIRGMTPRETIDLTLAMAHSGDVADLSSIKGIKVDKHSTGGVGDTTTLVVAPVVAACGGTVAKMSGRGLAHTGGTLDKLESIPGLRVERPVSDLISIANRIGLAVVGQSGDLAPADKKLYALRDVTATVDCIPLIASSIMSKKIAAGCDAIVLDVKTGSGAFMHDLDGSFELARQMVDIGLLAQRSVIALVTDMDQPLGAAVGNSLEVLEAVDILKGHRLDTPLWHVCRLLAHYMLVVSGFPEEGLDEKIKQAVTSGEAYGKLCAMVEAQGGDAAALEDEQRIAGVQRKVPFLASKAGYIHSIEAQRIGWAACLLGAGREKKEDVVDHATGLILKRRAGDPVAAGDELATLYVNEDKNLPAVMDTLEKAFVILEEKPSPRPIVFGMVDKDGIHRWNAQ
jgi:pyrimidine-nucleoside phosphorylase